MIENGGIEKLWELLAALNLKVEDFDLFLIGDGSGTVCAKPCGWAVRSFYIHPNKIVGERFDCGGATGGTNNYAELMPYLHSLWYYENLLPGKKRVLIVSDSEITVNCGSGFNERRSNLSLWASIDCLVRQGYRITWKHIPRSFHAFNIEADKSSREVRNLFEKLNVK